ncbi:MAG: hypothetical protein V2I51_02140 [Anderseniella sp.]|jgi:hypothetical protein|nr:hypothetical protein [Anderseniella sp.]
MVNGQHMDTKVQTGGKAGMSLCARMSMVMTAAALVLLGSLFAITGDWSYLKLAGVLGFLALLMIVFNLVLPARIGACGTDKTECGDAR